MKLWGIYVIASVNALIGVSIILISTLFVFFGILNSLEFGYYSGWGVNVFLYLVALFVGAVCIDASVSTLYFKRRALVQNLAISILIVLNAALTFVFVYVIAPKIDFSVLTNVNLMLYLLYAAWSTYYLRRPYILSQYVK